MGEKRFSIIKPIDEIEHKPVCSIDGEPWPCGHQRKASGQMWREINSVLCSGCGKRRNAWASLLIENALDGRTIYFHARRACLEKARRWWAENVTPITGDAFCEGQQIQNLARYVGNRTGLKAAQQ